MHRVDNLWNHRQKRGNSPPPLGKTHTHDVRSCKEPPWQVGQLHNITATKTSTLPPKTTTTRHTKHPCYKKESARQVPMNMLPITVQYFVQTLVSVRRIQAVLSAEDGNGLGGLGRGPSKCGAERSKNVALRNGA